ncbi:MAG: hypothetical protein IJH94_06505 [Clostridia bacterium]|nr:hypothetical protein [Clostridia bacterium]
MSKDIHTEAVNQLFQAILTLQNVDDCYTFFEDACTINELLSISQRVEVARILRAQEDIVVLEEKDYIKNPKPSGYRSYHMIIELPIYIGDEHRRVCAEVQIRTLSMDFWASLEHQIRYKHDVPNQAIVVSELRRCADEVASVELNFITIRDMINAINAANPPTE